MKIIKSIALAQPKILVLVLFLFSCKGDEEITPPISDIPEITFQNIEFHRSNSYSDSLVLTIKFKDRDMNLGLARNEIDSPYHAVNYFYLEGNVIKKTVNKNHPHLVKIADSDTLPPYNCRDFRINYAYEGSIYSIDTFYVEPNIGRTNILVEFYAEENGQFEKHKDFTAFAENSWGGCNPGFNVRFPFIEKTKTGVVKDHVDSPFKITLLNPFEGELKYTMVWAGIWAYLKDKRIKLKVKILDRDLNESNWIETPPFVIEEK